MNLGQGYRAVKKALGEGPPWLFDDPTIIEDLNISASTLCSASQALRDTYGFTTQICPNVPGGQTFYQEYAMPMSCESVTSGKVQIGTLWPLDFSSTQARLQTGGYVAGAPVLGYIRRGTNLTQQIPGSSELVFPAPGMTGKFAGFIIGLYPVPASAYQVWIDYVAYHPDMNEPDDPVLLPRLSFIKDAWTAYAKAKGFEAQGDDVNHDKYIAIHEAGVQKLKDYLLAQQSQLTPPTWGGDNSYKQGRGLTIAVMEPTATNLTVGGP